VLSGVLPFPFPDLDFTEEGFGCLGTVDEVDPKGLEDSGFLGTNNGCCCNSGNGVLLNLDFGFGFVKSPCASASSRFRSPAFCAVRVVRDLVVLLKSPMLTTGQK